MEQARTDARPGPGPGDAVRDRVRAGPAGSRWRPCGRRRQGDSAGSGQLPPLLALRACAARASPSLGRPSPSPSASGPRPTPRPRSSPRSSATWSARPASRSNSRLRLGGTRPRLRRPPGRLARRLPGIHRHAVRADLRRQERPRGGGAAAPSWRSTASGMTRPLGFANNYALGMRRARAAELGIKTISDLRTHPELRLGFSNEFLKRADGWPGLQARYGLPQTRPAGHGPPARLRGAGRGDIDVTELYTTDAEIKQFDLVALDRRPRLLPALRGGARLPARPGAAGPGGGGGVQEARGPVSADAVIAMNGAGPARRDPRRGDCRRLRPANSSALRSTAATESDAHRLVAADRAST